MYKKGNQHIIYVKNFNLVSFLQDAPCCFPNGRAACKSFVTKLASDLYGKSLSLSAWLDLGQFTR